MNKILMVLFLLMMVCVSEVSGQLRSKETLRGLEGVVVGVEFLHPDIEKDGLKRNQIQTDVELKLRLAGIKVLTIEELHEDFLNSKNPVAQAKQTLMKLNTLYINVASLKNRALELYAYSISVQFKQHVILERDKKISCSGITWYTSGTLGRVPTENVNSIRDIVKDKVDEFINDYLSVNPK